MGLQIVIDSADPAVLVRFWAFALKYVPESPPDGSASWLDYWRAMGVPEEELVGVEGPESVVDPEGTGPRIWFQWVPESKSVKNRLHLDLGVSGGPSVPLATRREQVDAEVARLGAAGATILQTHATPGLDHYGVTLADPEGNEFCVNYVGGTRASGSGCATRQAGLVVKRRGRPDCANNLPVRGR